MEVARFDIDANGIINVTAKDKATNNEQKVTITTGSKKQTRKKWKRSSGTPNPTRPMTASTRTRSTPATPTPWCIGREDAEGPSRQD